MARKAGRTAAQRQVVLRPQRRKCPFCGQRMWQQYENRRTVVSLQGPVKLRLKVCRCVDAECLYHQKAYRPESEGRWALPQHEFGLDVMALVGSLRYREHRSIPEIHRTLRQRGVEICERSVSNLLDRYDELLTLSLRQNRRLQELIQRQGRVILAIDGLQPDVGHEVLWVLRDVLSGQVLLARSLLSSTQADLAQLIREVVQGLPAPIIGVISDGQHSIRQAVAEALPEVPHQLCHFHYLREAGRPIFEADRHAKKVLKKKVRGVRPLERQVEGRDDPQAQVVLGYCAAVRSAITDDGRPPLAASGLKLQSRLTAIVQSLDRLAEKGGATSC